MNARIYSTFSALSNRQRLLLVLGFVLSLGLVIFNSFAASVDTIGWSSGFTHPLHGGDHFLTMLAVGIWAAQLRGKAIWLLPVTFVSVMSLGGLAGAAGIFIPSAEPIILLSCLVFSIFIARKIRFSNKTSVIIVAFFAFFHGFAHGQEISTSASLISYTLGFMVATLLLHSAGILIVKLCVLVFAMFMSHLPYAQSSNNHFSVQSGAYAAQIDTAHEFFMAAYPAPPDGYDRQLLYTPEDGNRDSEWAELRSCSSVENNVIFHDSPCYKIQKPVFGFASLCAIHQATCNIISRWLSADWLDHQHLGILFLASGVGETSPPVAIVFDSTPRCTFAAVFCHIADLGKPNHETIPRSDLSNLLILATSLLTNGVGATSPPVLLILLFAASIYFRHTLASFTALIISRQFLFCNYLFTQTQRKSRAPPLAVFIALQR